MKESRSYKSTYSIGWGFPLWRDRLSDEESMVDDHRPAVDSATIHLSIQKTVNTNFKRQ